MFTPSHNLDDCMIPVETRHEEDAVVAVHAQTLRISRVSRDLLFLFDEVEVLKDVGPHLLPTELDGDLVGHLGARKLSKI